jgi:sugar lactone lactonase YvrE
MKALTRLFLMSLLALSLTLLAALLRSPIEPEVWVPPPNPGFVDGFEPNSGLSGVTLVDVQGYGPEDVWCTADGKWMTGLEDGRIVMVGPDGMLETLGNTGGRPLGLQAMSDGSIIIVDADRGLLRLNENGSIDVLADEFEGQKIRFADDLDVSRDGIVWFSDASQRFGIEEFMLDLLEASRTGRLLSYDLNTGELRSHLEGLYFANGVALGPGEQFVLVNETAMGRVHRLWLKGALRGQTDIFIDGLPAMVDNISFNGSDRFWVASPNPRHALDALATRPLVRRIAAGLPSWVSKALEEPFSMVSAFDVEGELITTLRDPRARLNQITSVNECQGKLILGSLVSQSIGVVDVVDVR